METGLSTRCAGTFRAEAIPACHAERSEASGQRMEPTPVITLSPDPSLALRMTECASRAHRDGCPVAMKGGCASVLLCGPSSCRCIRAGVSSATAQKQAAKTNTRESNSFILNLLSVISAQTHTLRAYTTIVTEPLWVFGVGPNLKLMSRAKVAGSRRNRSAHRVLPGAL
jgi:hypothetical protein